MTEDAEAKWQAYLESDPEFAEVVAREREFEEWRTRGLEHLQGKDALEGFECHGEAVNGLTETEWYGRVAAWDNWRDYINGNRAALLVAFMHAAEGNLQPPALMRAELRRLLEALLSGELRNWADAFGPVREKGLPVRDGLKRRRILLSFYRFAQAKRYGMSLAEWDEWNSRALGKPPEKREGALPTDDAFFEMLGEQFGMSAATAKRLYYKTLKDLRFDGHVPGPRYPNGLDDCFGL